MEEQLNDDEFVAIEMLLSSFFILENEFLFSIEIQRVGVLFMWWRRSQKNYVREKREMRKGKCVENVKVEWDLSMEEVNK